MAVPFRIAALLLVCSSAVLAIADQSGPDAWDTTADPEDRAKALCANLTIDEKISLLHGTGWGHDVYVGVAKGVPGKGIPDLHLNDGPQGFRCNGLGKCPGGTSTQFPSGLTVAATWDANATKAWGTAMGKEFYAKGANVQLGPGMCIARVPKNGRNFEYMSGEDPYLGYTLVKGAIDGIQSQGVIANAKHYVLNNQETQRNSIDVQIDERTLYEIYLPPFKGAIDANVGSFMCSVMGKYSCEQNTTLNLALRDRLGAKGFVMSDWRAAHSTSILDGLDQQMPGDNYMGDALKDSKYKAAVDQSVVRILTPMFALGIMDKPNNNKIDTNVSTAASMEVSRQLSEQSTVLLKNKGSLLPLDKSKIKKIVLVGNDAKNPTTGGGGSGKVNPSYLPSPLAAISARFGIHAHEPQQPEPEPALERRPLAGDNCSDAQWEDNTDFFNPNNLGHSSGTGAADCCAKCAAMDGCLYFSFKKSGSMGKTCWFKASDAGRKTDSNVISGRCKPAGPTPPPTPAPPTPPPSPPSAQVLFASDGKSGASMAKDADLAIVFVSTSSAEGSDRGSLSFGGGDDMVQQVAAAQPNTIVVAVCPGMVLMPWSTDVAAILMAFMPGQMFADALTNLLFGDVAPSAKLPLTMPNKDNEQGWATRQWPGENGKVYYTEGLFVGYRYYDQHKVAFTTGFPFGHGLSYSTFDYSALAVKPASAANAITASADATSTAEPMDGGYGSGAAVATVSFTLKNNGTSSASDVPQLYLGFPPSAGEPPQVLRGFQKTQLAAGAGVTVTFPIAEQDVSVWSNSSHAWEKVSGKFSVFVGSSSRDIRLIGSLDVAF